MSSNDNKTSCVTIRSAYGTEFYQHLAMFSYGSFLLHGYGIVLVKQDEFKILPGERVEAHLRYIPYDAENPNIPDEAVEMLNEYNPAEDVIFVSLENSGEAMCLLYCAAQIGSTPKRLFDEDYRKRGYTGLVPGDVLNINEPLDDVTPGYYIFKGEDKAEVTLVEAGEDEEGLIIEGDKVVQLHVDFAEWMKHVLDLNIYE